MIWLIAAGMAAAVVGAVMGIAWITEPGRPAAGERHPGSYGTLVRPDAPKSA